MSEQPRALHRDSGWVKAELISFLEILALTVLVVSQPVLDVMGKSPETFVFRDAGTSRIVIFAVTATLVPAIALSVLLAATRLFGRTTRALAGRVVLWLLASFFGIQIIKRLTSLADVPLVVAGVAAGLLVVVAFIRVPSAHRLLRYAALAAPASLIAFLLLSPVSKLVTGSRSGSSAARAAPVPVVMMLFDQLPLESLIDRSGRIDAKMFPNFAELAGDATWYRNYTAIEPHTGYAIPTMLTGTIAVDRSKQPLAVDYPNNLFSLLRKSHHLEVFESVTRLCPGECVRDDSGESSSGQGGLGALFSDAWGVWRDLSLPAEATRNLETQFTEDTAAETGASPRPRSVTKESLKTPLPGGSVARVQAFNDSFRRSEAPTLHYLHLMLPHLPWRYFPSGSQYQVVRGGPRRDVPDTTGRVWGWVNNRWAVQLVRERHLLQVQFTDRLLGQAIKRMKKIGIYDDALVIVTSDHGLSLQPGRSRGPTQDNMHELYWVPLLMKQPHQSRGIIDNRNLMSTDLIPTIADSLDALVPWKTDGRSALDPDYDRGSVKSIVRRPERAIPWPQRTLSISVAEAWRRMLSEVFVPSAPCKPSRCVYATGPGAEVIGDSIGRYTMGRAASLVARLDLPRTNGVDAGNEGSLPALVWGILNQVPNGDALVVAAVGGRIGGVSSVWSQDGHRFGMLIPEDLVRRAPQDLRLFLLERDTLHPLSVDRP